MADVSVDAVLRGGLAENPAVDTSTCASAVGGIVVRQLQDANIGISQEQAIASAVLKVLQDHGILGPLMEKAQSHHQQQRGQGANQCKAGQNGKACSRCGSI